VRDREPRLRELVLLELFRCREFDERLLRGMIVTPEKSCLATRWYYVVQQRVAK